MAKKTVISDAVAELKELNKEAASLVIALQDVAKYIKNNAKEAAQITGESAEAYAESSKEAIDLSKQLQGYTATQLKNKKEEARFQKIVNQTQQNQSKIIAKIAVLEEKKLTASKTELFYINKAIKGLTAQKNNIEASLDYAKELQKTFEKISKETKFFEDLANFTKDIPFVNKVFSEFQKAAQAARDASVEGKNAFKAGAKELANIGTKALATLGIGLFVKGLKETDERITKISRSLNITRDRADSLNRSFNQFARPLQGVGGKQLLEAQLQFSDALGTTAILSNKVALNFTDLTNKLGLSVEEASKFTKFTEASGKEADKVTNEIVGQVILSNKQNKTAIDYKKILKDVANVSSAIKLSIGAQGKNLANASMEARKLGTNLSQLDQIAGSLLNFEESISAELEAELITGKDLNLEKARLFALNNDLVGLSRELSAQGITAAKFGNMNRIAQEAIAKSFGLSRDSMADMLIEQEALSKFGAKDKQELNEKIDLELKRINGIKDAGQKEIARKALINKLGSDEIVRQRENQSLAERQAEAMEKLVNAFDKMQPLVDAISKGFGIIGTHAEAISKILLMIAGGALLAKIARGFQGVAGAFKTSGVGTSTSSSTAGAASTGARSMAQQVSQLKAQNPPGMTTPQAVSQIKSQAMSQVKSGGFFSKFKNPLTVLKDAIKNNGKAALKQFGKTALIGSLIEGIFLSGDIKSLIEQGGSQKDIYNAVGKRVAESLGGVLGGASLTALVTALTGGVGGMASMLLYYLGDKGGRWVANQLSDAIGAEGLGEWASETFYGGKMEAGRKNQTITTEDFTIRTHPKDTLVMAGGTKLGNNSSNNETSMLLKELISAVKTGGNVYIDGNKAGTAFNIGTYRTQ